jgi:hypothetical protein
MDGGLVVVVQVLIHAVLLHHKDLAADTQQFVYQREHFFRIGAVATGSGVNSGKRYNFSPVFKMSSDFSKVEIVTDWDED